MNVRAKRRLLECKNVRKVSKARKDILPIKTRNPTEEGKQIDDTLFKLTFIEIRIVVVGKDKKKRAIRVNETKATTRTSPKFNGQHLSTKRKKGII